MTDELIARKEHPSHCVNGHRYVGNNITFDKSGHIRCRECKKHHAKKSRSKLRCVNDTEKFEPSADDIRRFEDKYLPEPNCGCWLWDGAISDTGYGSFYYQRIYMSAHRFSYLLHVGSIESGLDLDHICRVRNCVNPAHLDLVSRLENVRRGQGGTKNRTKTHCKWGHEYTVQNTIHIKTTCGTGRTCRACAKERYKKRKSQ